LLRILALGGACGAVLGLFALGYTTILHLIPSLAETFRKSQETLAKFHI